MRREEKRKTTGEEEEIKIFLSSLLFSSLISLVFLKRDRNGIEIPK
jgi:hypothetical protein